MFVLGGVCCVLGLKTDVAGNAVCSEGLPGFEECCWNGAVVQTDQLAFFGAVKARSFGQAKGVTVQPDEQRSI